VDVPVRALRSIAGKVYLRLPPPAVKEVAMDKKTKPAKPTADDSKLVPLADVQITAGYGVAKTDKDGAFLLRNLPAGNLTITLVPVKPLPEGLQLPNGSVKMPAEPIQVQGATIVISNPELVPYLTGRSVAEIQNSFTQSVVPAGFE
jgi:hypothetical protein